MSQFSCILFDLDGTLIDSLAGIEYAAQQSVEKVLPGRRMGSLRSCIGPPMRIIFSQSFPDLSAFDLDQLEICFRQIYDTVGWSFNHLYPGVLETLPKLPFTGAQCFVVTYKPYLPTGKIIRSHRLEQYFVEVLSPDSRLPRFSTKQECVGDLLVRRELDPARVLLVGDTASDAQVARDCGLAFVLARYGYGRMQESPGALAVIDSFADLLGVV